MSATSKSNFMLNAKDQQLFKGKKEERKLFENVWFKQVAVLLVSSHSELNYLSKVWNGNVREGVHNTQEIIKFSIM